MTGPLNPNTYRAQEIQRLTQENDALKREVESLRKFVSSLDSLQNASDTFADDSALIGFMRGMLITAMQLLNAPAGSLLLLDDETDELVFAIVIGALADQLQDERMPANEGIAGWVLRNKKITMVRDVRVDPRFYNQVDQTYAFKTQSIAAAPLIGDRKVYGLVEILNQVGDEPFSDGDMVLLKIFCRAAGEALADIDRLTDKED